MNLLLVTDAYPPMRTSGAVHLFDLGQAFLRQSHQVCVVIPNDQQTQSVCFYEAEGCEVISVKAWVSKDQTYLLRVLAEFCNPLMMWWRLQRSPQFLARHIDGVIWYSPTIFWGPLIKRFKRQFNCPAYLILRDLFPDWAVDLGLLKENWIYRFLKYVERYQYQQANCIGLQSPQNLRYFTQKQAPLQCRLEVLWNWAAPSNPPIPGTPHINLAQSRLAGRFIFVYAGNMGIAQKMDAVIALANSLRSREDMGFVLVGRGSEVGRLKTKVKEMGLSNLLFFDEIEPKEIPYLYRQCHAGIVALDVRHRTHNIPGKLVSYLHAGLPIYAIVNKGNDLVGLIENHHLGVVSTDDSEEFLLRAAEQFIAQIASDKGVAERCKVVAKDYFSVQVAAQQITGALQFDGAG